MLCAYGYEGDSCQTRRSTTIFYFVLTTRITIPTSIGCTDEFGLKKPYKANWEDAESYYYCQTGGIIKKKSKTVPTLSTVNCHENGRTYEEGESYEDDKFVYTCKADGNFEKQPVQKPQIDEVNQCKFCLPPLIRCVNKTCIISCKNYGNHLSCLENRKSHCLCPEGEAYFENKCYPYDKCGCKDNSNNFYKIGETWRDIHGRRECIGPSQIITLEPIDVETVIIILVSLITSIVLTSVCCFFIFWKAHRTTRKCNNRRSRALLREKKKKTTGNNIKTPTETDVKSETMFLTLPKDAYNSSIRKESKEALTMSHKQTKVKHVHHKTHDDKLNMKKSNPTFIDDNNDENNKLERRKSVKIKSIGGKKPKKNASKRKKSKEKDLNENLIKKKNEEIMKKNKKESHDRKTSLSTNLKKKKKYKKETHDRKTSLSTNLKKKKRSSQ